MNYTDISNFGKTKLGWFIAFLWGLAEGLVFFIVPDLYLSFIALFTFTGGIISLGFALLGSLISAVLIFSLAPYFGAYYHNILVAIPGISESMVGKVAAGLSTHGIRDIISGPFSGIPYKIYSVEAVSQHFPLIQYLIWSIPARLERMLPVTILGLILGYFFKRHIQKHPKIWIAGFIVLWIFIYINYYRSLS